jgi:hypothetical protein
MTNRSEAEISEAVRDCARHCAKVTDAAACLSDYKQKLLDAGWTEVDANEVVSTTRQVLDSIGGQIQ